MLTIDFLICRERIKQRLALYHGVLPIYMQLSNDAEETFSRALKLLVVSDLHTTLLIFVALGSSPYVVKLFPTSG